MGFLMDIRSGKRPGSSGHAIVAWMFIGAALGFLAATFFPQFGYAPVVIAGAAGAAIGLYAEFGTSSLARVLAVPGFPLEFIW
jgi:uncharacterized membrane protein YeaQ/YmgE (transglycosylase-associated protein family)